MYRTLFILLIALILIALLAMKPPGKNDPVSLKASLMQTDREFGAATAARGTAGWMEYFAQETAIFPPGSAPITGLAAVRAHYEKIGPGELRWTPIYAEASADGTLGYTWGTWTYPGKDANGDPQTSTGRYLTVWRRQKDGRWKIAADIGNNDPPPAK